jgi:hypothetical protein
MATGTRATYAAATHLPQGLIYPELVHGGLVETLVQNTNAFNAASRNAIRLVANRKRGDYAQESFWGTISNLVSRRDPNSVATAAGLVVPKNEMISIKINRKVGPVDQTLDSFRKLGQASDPEVLSFLLGTQIAKAMQVDQLDAALRSTSAALAAQAAVLVDQSAGGSPTAGRTLTTDALVQALAKKGDAASRVVTWVMHSKPYYDLVRSQITANIDGVSNFVVAQASPVTLNRPVIVTDSAGLTFTEGSTSPNSTGYYTLGLDENGVVVEDTEEELFQTDIITGLENILVRLQGEYAYNMTVKGFKFNLTTSPMAINPTDAQLGTGSNWTKVHTSNKDLAGVILMTR